MYPPVCPCSKLQLRLSMPRKHCNPPNLLVTAHDGHMTEGGRCLLSLHKLPTRHCTSTLRYYHFTEHTQPKKPVDTSALREDWWGTGKSREGAAVWVCTCSWRYQHWLTIYKTLQLIEKVKFRHSPKHIVFLVNRQLFFCLQKEYNSNTPLLWPNLHTIRTQTRFPIKDNHGNCTTDKVDHTQHSSVFFFNNTAF